MRYSPNAAIDFVNVAYDLSGDASTWLSRLVDAADALVAGGYGALGVIVHQSPPPITFRITTCAGPDSLRQMGLAALADLPSRYRWANLRTGVSLVSEDRKGETARLAHWRPHLGSARDLVGLIALDTCGSSLQIFAPLPEEKSMTPGERSRWEMLAIHASYGLRRRRTLGSMLQNDPSGLAHRADAFLREAAIRADRAPSHHHGLSPGDRFGMWKHLVKTGWPMLDSFDSNGRRYVLAVRPDQHVDDPRALTKRENQVAAHAALGEKHKVIADKLGISRTRVTAHLGAIKRKLGVRSHAELVWKLRAYVEAFGRAPSATESSDTSRT
jgi:DNA-binding CsgD family transcriptional regulator